MSDGQTDIRYREIVFHHDDQTPLPFLIELLHSVFKKQQADAFRFTNAIQEEGKASCGSYPRDVADELLEAARKRIDEAGHSLRITSRTSSADDDFLRGLIRRGGAIFGITKTSQFLLAAKRIGVAFSRPGNAAASRSHRIVMALELEFIRQTSALPLRNNLDKEVNSKCYFQG